LLSSQVIATGTIGPEYVLKKIGNKSQLISHIFKSELTQKNTLA
jgi:hypothetical protein